MLPWWLTSGPGCAGSWLERGAAEAELVWIATAFDPRWLLTIGFARRVPTYKRLTLMLRDPGRLEALLLDPEHPVQLIVAGGAHPADGSRKGAHPTGGPVPPTVRGSASHCVPTQLRHVDGAALIWGCDIIG